MDGPIAPPPRVTALASVFARYGNSTFGGGTATIVEIEKHIIDEHQWLSRDDSHLAYAICRLTPGTNLLAYCVGVGWRIRGVGGAAVALTSASLPCAAFAVVLTMFLSTWSAYPFTKSALKGALAAAIGIMIGTAWTMIRPAIQQRHYARTLLYGIVACVLAVIGALTPFQLLLVAAVTGAVAAPAEATP